MDENRYDTLIDDMNEERSDRRTGLVKWVVRSAVILGTILFFGVITQNLLSLPTHSVSDQIVQFGKIVLILPAIVLAGAVLVVIIDFPRRKGRAKAKLLIAQILDIDSEFRSMEQRDSTGELTPRVKELLSLRSDLCQKLSNVVLRNGLDIYLHQITSDNHLPRL